ncbi:MAG TPA: hypothetical protein VFQ39_18680 [Longimicrobium sp.]|nr:hypothetical protein [Longimicrobium sp.]
MFSVRKLLFGTALLASLGFGAATAGAEALAPVFDTPEECQQYCLARGHEEWLWNYQSHVCTCPTVIWPG